MTIIFFHGLGSSKKQLDYIYKNYNYAKTNFIKQLKKIDKVFIPEIPYTNVYYYFDNDSDPNKTFNKMYKPIDKKINLDDLTLDKYIENLYNSIDKQKYKSPYILIGHSHGIYYACEFANQYNNEVACIVSLDGSWITTKLNKNRLKKLEK